VESFEQIAAMKRLFPRRLTERPNPDVRRIFARSVTRKNAVTAAVDELGGVLQVAVIAKCVPETVYRAMRLGRFVSAGVVIRLAVA
jgi:hypothetical protein